MTVEREDESVRLRNANVREAVDAKNVIAQGEVLGEDRAHFILFLSGRLNSRAKVKGSVAFRGAKSLILFVSQSKVKSWLDFIKVSIMMA